MKLLKHTPQNPEYTACEHSVNVGEGTGWIESARPVFIELGWSSKSTSWSLKLTENEARDLGQKLLEFTNARRP